MGHRLDSLAPLPIVPARPHQPAIQPLRAWSATPLDELASPMDSEVVRIVVGLPLLVLLIACTNLANLMLSRASSRRHETALRGALGASRWRLLQEHLAETVVIAAAGGLLGALVAHGLLTWGVSVLREPVETFTPGLMLVWRLEPVIFVAAGASALVSLLAAGLVPALQAIRVDAGRALTVGDPTSAMPRWRWRSNLIAVQVGMSAGLFLITVVCVRFLVIDASDRIPPGLTSLAVAGVEFDGEWPAARVEDTAHRIVEEARRLPNVAAAAASTGLPIEARTLLGVHWSVRADAADAPPPVSLVQPPPAGMVAATAGLPAVMGLEVLSGRFVGAGDRGRNVAIDERLATALFGPTPAVGRQLRLRHGGAGPAGPPPVESLRTVIGIVGAAPASERSIQRGSLRGVIFIPFAERTEWDDRLWPIVVFSARARSGEATDLAPLLRTVVRRVDQDLAVVGAMRGDLAAGGEVVVMAPILAAGFGLLAVMSLALAMAGLYGVLSHVVTSRTREMGIRVALGASRLRIRTLVLGQGLRPVVEGLAIGLGVALVARQLLQMTMTETLSTVNVASFAAAAAPLIVAGCLAAYLPARRASRVNPNVALRDL
jgi:predicted permease